MLSKWTQAIGRRLVPGAGALVALALLSVHVGTAAAQVTPSADPTPGQTITITQQDNGQTFNIQVGDRVIVKMGTSLDWTVNLDPQGILVPVPGVGTLVRGVQGIYVAAQPGTVTLTATGRPDCSAGSVCPDFIQQVQVTINVGPTPISGCFPVGDPPHIVCA